MAASELSSGRPSPTATNGPHSRQGFLSAMLGFSKAALSKLHSRPRAERQRGLGICFAMLALEKVVLGSSLERVRMSRPAYGAATSHVERYGALQERKLLRKIASVMQFGSLVVEG
jgi:hypothetical protein